MYSCALRRRDSPVGRSSNTRDGAAPAGSTARVQAYNNQSVQVQRDHQRVLDGEEQYHLVEDVEVDHEEEPDHQERHVLDEQGHQDAQDVRAVLSQEGHLAGRLLVISVWLDGVPPF